MRTCHPAVFGLSSGWDAVFLLNDLWIAVFVYFYAMVRKVGQENVMDHPSPWWTFAVITNLLPDTLFHLSGDVLFAMQWIPVPVFAIELYRWWKGMKQAWGWRGGAVGAALLIAQGIPPLSWHPLTHPNPFDTPHFYFWHGVVHVTTSAMLLLYVRARLRILESERATPRPAKLQ